MEEVVRVRVCFLFLSFVWIFCYFTLLGVLVFLFCVLGLGCFFSYVGWFLWIRLRGFVGESI